MFAGFKLISGLAQAFCPTDHY